MPYYNRDPKRDHNFDNHPYIYIYIYIYMYVYRGFSGSIIELIQGDTRSLGYSGSFPLYPWDCVPEPWNMVLNKGIWDT